MVGFDRTENGLVQFEGTDVHIFSITDNNIDEKTVKSFGEEWTKFNHFNEEEIRKAGDQYFDIVSDKLIEGKYILDVGCGTGRWTKYLLNKAAFVECIDPSDAVYAAAKLLRGYSNVRVSQAGAESIPFPDNSFDFVFSLGVLHHTPDTETAMRHCVKKVKGGGYFMVYLYYSLDNRGLLFKILYRTSDFFRRIICRLPSAIKKFICDLIAVFVYMPFVLITKFFRLIGLKKISKKIPLSYYADHSFRIIKNDALDRFGTPLEQRFSKQQIKEMMQKCGLTNIVFSDNEPYWHALGQKL